MKNFINEIELTKIIDKIKIYNQEEIDIFNKIINRYRNINEYYKTNNNDLLLYIKSIMTKKFNIIVKNHYCNIQIITKTINNYVLARNKATKIINNINKG